MTSEGMPTRDNRRKSSYSGAVGNCVEAEVTPNAMVIGDTKLSDSNVCLRLSRAAGIAFVASLRRTA